MSRKVVYEASSLIPRTEYFVRSLHTRPPFSSTVMRAIIEVIQPCFWGSGRACTPRSAVNVSLRGEVPAAAGAARTPATSAAPANRTTPRRTRRQIAPREWELGVTEHLRLEPRENTYNRRKDNDAPLQLAAQFRSRRGAFHRRILPAGTWTLFSCGKTSCRVGFGSTGRRGQACIVMSQGLLLGTRHRPPREHP